MSEQGSQTDHEGHQGHEGAGEAATYDVEAVQAKWQQVWDELEPFRADDDAVTGGVREKRYALTMFPYPSGDLHMGHAEVFALHDVIARYWRFRGYEVLNPMGWDSFGLPAENAAIRNDEHPATYTYANIETQAASMKNYGLAFDWSRRLHTSDPEYYRWTQWLFLKFRERGLAYRKNSPVNWCPQRPDRAGQRAGRRRRLRAVRRRGHQARPDAVVLQDHRVRPGAAGRPGRRWRRRWPDRVITAQRNWIGRSEGAHVDFVVEGRDEPLTVYTTRPDTLFGATFMVVAADAALAAELVTDAQRPAYEAYLESSPHGLRHRPAGQRPAQDRRRPGRHRHQPGHRRADPGVRRRLRAGRLRHRRDHGRARPGPARLGLRAGLRPAGGAHRAAARGLRRARRSPATARRSTRPTTRSRVDGMGVAEAKSTVISLAGVEGHRPRHGQLPAARLAAEPPALLGRADPGRSTAPSCGEVDVPLDQLPVELPELRGADLKPKGTSPLAAADGLGQRATCPSCGGPAKRDSDTMDTFVDSSWYFLRFTSPGYADGPFDPARANAWMPADIYIGGVEHAVLHLLYARFFTKVLRDMGLLEFGEPFAAQLNQGFVINQGKKMSKSLGNGVSLGDQLSAFGVDAVRLTLIFAGPPEDDIDWADMSPAGSLKFLQRAWRLSGDVTSAPGADPATGDVALRRVTHRVVRRRPDAGREPPVQRDGRPRHGAGERHPQGHRLGLRAGRPRRARGRRGGGHAAVAGGAVRRRGDVGAAGPRARRSPRPPGPSSTRPCWSRSR